FHVAGVQTCALPIFRALSLTAPSSTASVTAARGPIALATSLAPWAKLSRAAEKIRGRVNRLLTASRVLGMELAERVIAARDPNQAMTAAPSPIRQAVRKLTGKSFFTPLSIR